MTKRVAMASLKLARFLLFLSHLGLEAGIALHGLASRPAQRIIDRVKAIYG